MYAAELHLPHVLREHWIRSVLVTALFLLNMADVFTTQMVLNRGGIELNPLSAWLIEQGLLAHAKVAVVSVIAVLAGIHSAAHRMGPALGAVTVAYIAVVASNGAQLLAAS